MGGSSKSKSQESALSLVQHDIIKKRQADYEKHFKPLLISGLEEAESGANKSAIMAQQTLGANQNYLQSKNNFNQSMAQRGLGGTGVEAQGLASLQNTRAQNLANAYYSAQQQGDNRKLDYLQLALQMTPATSTAAPILSSTQSSNNLWNFLGAPAYQ